MVDEILQFVTPAYGAVAAGRHDRETVEVATAGAVRHAGVLEPTVDARADVDDEMIALGRVGRDVHIGP